MTNSLKKCSICGTRISYKYSHDIWGNFFCIEHIRSLPSCSSCTRLICNRLTNGATYYPDGLIICNLCEKKGVFSSERGQYLLKEMRQELFLNGLDLGDFTTQIKLVNRDTLIKASFRGSNKGHLLMGLTRCLVSKVGEKVVSSRLIDILVQKGLPEEHFKLVAIHELCHAWIFYNEMHSLSKKIEEGLCVLSEYLWLQRQSFPQAIVWKKRLLQSNDSIYGDGFREVLTCFKKTPLPRMMRYIKEKNKLPGFWGTLWM